MKCACFVSLALVVSSFVLAQSASAEIIYATTATVIPASDFKNQDTPNSSTVTFGEGTAFAKSDAYFIRGWVNSGNAVKSANAKYEEHWNQFEFEDRYGVFPGGGTLAVTAAYKLSLAGNSVNGGSVGLRLEGISQQDDTVSTVSPISDSGTLYAEYSGSYISGIRMRITGNVSTGGNSSGLFAVSITDISYNGISIFTGPPPAPEPSTAVLALLGSFAVFPIRRSRRQR